MEPIARKAVSGVLYRRKEQCYLRLYIAISSYCADRPEQKEMVSV